jgi:hypothetical protein
MAEVRKFLTVSTEHTPPGTIDRDVFNDGEVPGAIIYRHADMDGAWLWVPDEPRESALRHEDAPESWLLALQLAARAHGCDYVLIDRDGPIDAELPRFCQACGGNTYKVSNGGCRECCRDCGRPCDHDKNAEGFHA